MRKRLGREAARADSAAPAPTSAGRVPPAGPISAAWRDLRSAPWTTASDVIIALAFFFLLCISRPDSAPWLIEGAGPVFHSLLVGACALALVVRRHSPLLFVLVAGICLSAHLVLFTEFSVFFVVTGLIAVETTQSRLEAPWRWVALVLELVGVGLATTRVYHLIGGYIHAGEARMVVVVNIWLVTMVTAFVGAARRRSRDRYIRALERASVLEAQQAAERRLAVIETQQRIARDVHDLLGHSLTVIAMQAEGARAILATDPAAADEALAVIGETSRRSVDEVPWSTCCVPTSAASMSMRPPCPVPAPLLVGVLTPGLPAVPPVVPAAGLPALLRPEPRMAPEPERRRRASTWSFCANRCVRRSGRDCPSPWRPTRLAGSPWR